MFQFSKREFIIAILTFLAGIGLFYYGAEISPFFRGFGGDVLVVMFLFFLLSTFLNVSRVSLILSVFVIASAIELAQLFVPQDFGGRIGELVLGSTFDPIDFLAYAFGLLIAYLITVFVDKLEVR